MNDVAGMIEARLNRGRTVKVCPPVAWAPTKEEFVPFRMAHIGKIAIFLPDGGAEDLFNEGVPLRTDNPVETFCQLVEEYFDGPMQYVYWRLPPEFKSNKWPGMGYMTARLILTNKDESEEFYKAFFDDEWATMVERGEISEEGMRLRGMP
jgi:hypothetical protein